MDNGADWQIVTRDGVSLIDTRYCSGPTTGSTSIFRQRGTASVPGGDGKVAAGEPVDPGLYYFRVTMQFETSSKKI
jgi:hypothetical protein